MSDEFDALIAETRHADAAQAARVGFSAASDTNPDAFAEAQRVARSTGVPVDTVFAQPKEMKRQAAVGTIDFDTLARESPATAAMLADIERAKLAHDDVDNMGEIERKLRQFAGGTVEAVGMAASGTGQLLDIAQRNLLGGLAAVVLPKPLARGRTTAESITGPLIGEDWRTVGGAIKSTARDDLMVPAAQQTFGDQVAAGVGQVLGQVLMLPVARGAGLYAQGADAMAEKVAPDIAGQGAKDLAVLAGAGVTGITEKWALDRLLGPLAVPIKNKVAASLARVGVAAAAEGGQEFTENLLQDTLRVLLTNPDAPIDIGQSIGEGGVGAAVGGFVRGIVEAGLHVRARGLRGEREAEQAEIHAEALARLNALAAASKLASRDPETFEQFIAQAAEEGPVQAVFLDAQVLMQSGIAEQLAAVSPAVAEQLETAVATGGRIAIPIEEYAARIAPTEYAQGLLDQLSTTPEGFSRAEAQEYMQGAAEALQADAERVLAEKEGDDTFKESAEAVRANLKAQLDTVGRFAPQVNDAYASLVSNFFAVTAAKIGTTPEALYQRYPLKVGAQGIAGPQFDQTVWHGTPHVWAPEPGFPHGRPRLDKMGTGEGAQAYGWGWYSAESRGVASSYSTAPGAAFSVAGKTYAQLQNEWFDLPKPNRRAITALADSAGNAAEALSNLEDQISPESKQAAELLRGWIAAGEVKSLKGTVYQLDIPDDVLPRLLDWDKPLSDLPSKTREALYSIPGRWATIGGARRYIGSPQAWMAGRQVYKALSDASGGDQKASEYLASIGIPGIRYLDGNSRADGEGTYNYVVWDQPTLDRIALLERNGEKLDAMRAAGELFQSGAQGDAYAAKADMLDRALTSVGFSVRRASSRVSKSEYLYAKTPDYAEDDKGDVVSGRELKFRFSDHTLPDSYEQADFDVSVSAKRADTAGTWIDAAKWAARIAGTPVPAVVSAVEARAKTKEQKDREAMLRRVLDLAEKRLAASSALSEADAKRSSSGIWRVADKQVGKGLGSAAAALAEYKRLVAKERDEARAALADATGDELFQSPEQGEFAATEREVGGRAAYDKAKAAGKTKLNYGQWVQVRTPAFKAWFGDWEGDPANASKVVDPDTGEPLVVYHGTGQAMVGSGFNPSLAKSEGAGFYFSHSPLMRNPAANANDYAANRAGDSPNVVPVYLRMHRPLVAGFPEPMPADDKAIEAWLDRMQKFNRSIDTTKVRYYRNAINTAKAGGHDGAIVRNVEDVANDAGRRFTDEADVYIAFAPEQIKSAIGNRGTFDATDANILNQSADNRGAFNPDTLSITLLKKADWSTFLHEAGHFFLEVQFDLSAKLRQDAVATGADTLTPGERQIIADTDALLAWFGVRDLSEWYNLDFEQRRSYHEQFARGFEAYLFEGTPPSIELHGLFQRLRAWLLHVYKKLEALNVDLTDEVRGVFARMIATNEQIALAEQARSMLPLFASPEQAGMTTDEFAAYQALGVESTAGAIEELQARGLRDMQWLRNARGRLLKKLQQEAKEQRAEVEMEARREVMSQPVYRAWQFLTGKLTADDKLARPPASDPNTLDETVDSLFVAIGKLGGINKDEVVGTWGIDPADKPQSGVFGKPLWRRGAGGLSIDGMAEALAQYGYLDLDANGAWDLRDFEERFRAELGGDPVYSVAYDYDRQQQARAGDQLANPQALGAGRLDLGELQGMDLPAEVVNALKARKMTAANGLHPDIVADIIGGFTSGDEMVRKLAAVDPPATEIEALTDTRMLEQFGDLASPEAIEKAADMAVHNDARMRFVTAEANALARALSARERTGTDRRGRPLTRLILPSAAKAFAREMVSRLKVRNVRPGQYAAAEVRAAKASAKAFNAGDVALAAAEKRNQVLQGYATRAAYDAQAEVARGVRYLKRFQKDVKGLDAGYAEQIHALLERLDLRQQSNKAVDKRTALSAWLTAQREAGYEPDIPEKLAAEAFRTHYKNLTVEEFRGLVDAVRQIEHLGRTKNRLLTARRKREYEAARDEIAGSIDANAQGRQADTRTPTTNLGRWLSAVKKFGAAHIKAATWARIMDGGQDGGPVWEYFVRSANERGDQETTMRAEATAKLAEIFAPVLKTGRNGGAGRYFPSIGRSLNREARIALALNTGNAGNRQRLLGGEGWTWAQVEPVLQSLTPQELAAVQAVWDHFESYRPLIAAKERRVYGKEPAWVEPQPFTVTTTDGTVVQMRGGYYPIKFDPAASQRAEEHTDAEGAKRQMQGAYTSATTRRSFTKTRVEEVSGRPLLYTLAGMYSGVNDVIHDLAWHEWLIDANRLLRSHAIDAAIREHYGPAAKQQLKTWVQDIAEGDQPPAGAGEAALGYLRQGVSAAGLGFNVMSAAIQITGFNQSIVRIGARWVGRGIAKYLRGPLALTRTVNGLSDFMANRSRTRFRELNELRNRIEDQSAVKRFAGEYAYLLMMRMQQVVDVPTWWGAYEKAVAAGNDEERSVALADQAVLDAQGGGQTKDLSAIERGGPAMKLFTVFYGFMNTTLNLGVGKTMTADTPAKRAKLAADYLLLYVVPPVLGFALKDALVPGDSGDDWDEIARKLIAEQLGYLMGLMVVVREFGDVARIVAGTPAFGYQGPAGVRAIADAQKFVQQARQGEFDDAFRKAAINLIGDFTGLPAAQANRTITGAAALAEGKTANPAALAFGFQEPR